MSVYAGAASNYDMGKTPVGTSSVPVLNKTLAFQMEKGVSVKAANDNSGVITISLGAVAAGASWSLRANEEKDFDVADARQLMAIASASSQNIFWFAR